MNCVKLNIRSVIIIILGVMFNGVKYSHMAVNTMDEGIVKEPKKNTSSMQIDTKPANPTSHHNEFDKDDLIFCNSKSIPCVELPYPCIKCDMNETCVYGQPQKANCLVRSESITCEGDRRFERDMICRYCYQTEIWEHSCTQKATCNSVSTPRSTYRTNCSTHGDIICLGKRDFLKNVQCNWTGGYKWSTAVFLSITLGGFGADRFYLGHWQEGIGKLFSFGGLGVWTLIDVILISLHYLGPADGSLFL